MVRPGTLVWTGLAAIVAIAISAGALRVTYNMRTIAVDVQSELLGHKATVDSLVRDKSARDELSTTLIRVQHDFESVIDLNRWIQRLSPSVAWLPVAELELTAWAVQIERVNRDLEVARLLMASSSNLMEIYADLQSVLVDTRFSQSAEPLKLRVEDLLISFLSVDTFSDEVIKDNKPFSVTFLVPEVMRINRVIEETEQLMSDSTQIGTEISQLLIELLPVVENVNLLVTQFSSVGENTTLLTTEQINVRLLTLSKQIPIAKTNLDDTLMSISSIPNSEELVSELDDLGRMLFVLASFNDAAILTMSVVEPAILEMQHLNAGPLVSGILIDILDAFEQRQTDIANAIEELEAAEALLDDIRASSGSGAFQHNLLRSSKFVSDFRNGLELVDRIAPYGRELLGVTGIRRYLLLGQSSDELRATGGFVSAIWLVTFQDGNLVDIKYQDSVRVDDWERLNLYPKAPDGLEEHMNAWVWLLRDVSWDPDFPTTASTAKDMYVIGQRLNVDGVIAINQWALLALVKSLGGIPAPKGDVQVTSRNLLDVLEEGTDQHGRAYMDLVFQGVVDQINNPASMPALMNLASTLQETLKKRETLVYFDNTELQLLTRDLRWDGGIRHDLSDYLYVVDSNVGWSKVDRNIQRKISYQVDFRRKDRPRVTLTLGYENHSGPNSPSCDPQWLSRDTDYRQYKNACYWNFLRIYLPQGSSILSTTPLPLPIYSVSVEIGEGIAGETSIGLSSSHDRLVFSGLVPVEAGEKREVTLVYDLPSSVVTRGENTITYKLVVQKQPGVRERALSLDILVPNGFQLMKSSHSIEYFDNSMLVISTALTEDTVIELTFMNSSEGSN